MKQYVKSLVCTFGLLFASMATADNQTPTVSEIFPGSELPYSVSLELSEFQLPVGLHSGIIGECNGEWLYIGGRTNGMHGFEDDTGNFPLSQQNSVVYVIDFKHETVYSRSLYDSNAGLTQEEIDTLSVTSPQFYQKGRTLYVTGGYGVITATGNFSTKDALTAINVPGLIKWVKNENHNCQAINYIRQIYDPIFKVTGGDMYQVGTDPTLLIFGQDFDGFYFDGGNGNYTNQVRRFRIIDDGDNLEVIILPPKQADETYRRRDGNIIPGIRYHHGHCHPYFICYSGVFTLTEGAWTVPVVIESNGNSVEADPALPETFKQGMNNYVSPFLGLYSKKSSKMYTTIFGGISFGFFSGGTFQTDPELPFINQITTIRVDKNSNFKQYLMDATYPVILSTGSNLGNQLLFGAAAEFVPVQGLKTFSNGVVDFDSLRHGRKHVGYIVGGIMSTLPNTTTITDSTSSPYIFKVYVERHRSGCAR